MEGVPTKIRGRATLKAIIQGKYSQGRRSSYQSARADPLLLKCSWRGREAVVGLRALKMVYLVPTQYFNAVTTHQFSSVSFTSKFVRSFLVAV